ncbi:hypothetical protein RJ55_05914 [Drechmeria coniospora]|nr:hypothetical protein RJ55_05914 [Drechmeria coniospora]
METTPQARSSQTVTTVMVYLVLLIAATAVLASTLKPPVLPLLVRNPYLSAWMSNARDPPWEHWPMFWTGQPLGLSVMVFVPHTKTVYPLLGRPVDSLPELDELSVKFPVYKGASFDASTTNLTYSVSSADSSRRSNSIVLSFLSPITPLSTLRQSMPAAYLTVYAEGVSDIVVYADVNGEWLSGNGDSNIEWQLREPSAGPTKSWHVSRATQLLFTEFSDRAEWGTFHFTGPRAVQHQSGPAAAVRLQFATKGYLTGGVDNRFRPIKDSEPVFAFALPINLTGTGADRKTKRASVTFTVALAHDSVAQFAAARGLTYMRPLWASYFHNTIHMLDYHYSDFEIASKLARSYSQQLEVDAVASGSHAYRDITFLSARQVMGATQFSGTPDSPLLFLKEISSNGNFQTVDVIFPAFPFFLYTNPRWLAYLLEPLLEHQLSGQYPNNYSMHDLGAHFPNATGHADGKDEYMPLEECGNMLIMGLALVNSMRHRSHAAWATAMEGSNAPERVQATDAALIPLQLDSLRMDRPIRRTAEDAAVSWASRSLKLWKRWAGYLLRESLMPRNQLSTDDFAGWLANQTNLALKGIIGIRAMADISELVGDRQDAHEYESVSRSFVVKWLEYGLARDGTHAKLAYSWYGSWTTLYNLFADSMLCFHTPGVSPSSLGRLQKPLGKRAKDALLPDRLYRMQSTWYHAVRQRYGLPLDSRHLYTKSDWELFAAAVASRKTRNAIVESVALWVNETVTDGPLTDLYDTEGDGNFSPIRFMARPVVGGHFARLALERACEGKATTALAFLDEGSENT